MFSICKQITSPPIYECCQSSKINICLFNTVICQANIHYIHYIYVHDWSQEKSHFNNRRKHTDFETRISQQNLMNIAIRIHRKWNNTSVHCMPKWTVCLPHTNAFWFRLYYFLNNSAFCFSISICWIFILLACFLYANIFIHTSTGGAKEG